MDCKKRILQLMHDRDWTIYKLSQHSGLARTTLANMFKRDTEPSLPSLKAICSAFGITLSQFFAEGTLVELTDEQAEFFLNWAALTPKQKTMLMTLVKSLK